MGAGVDLGNGTTVTFLTSAFSAEVTEISIGGISREAVDVTHLGIVPAAAGKFGSKVFKPAKTTDPGEIRMTIHFDPDDTPPTEKVAEQVRIVFPVPSGMVSGAIWQGEGFVTGYEAGIPLDDKMTATVTVKLSGNQTITAAA